MFKPLKKVGVVAHQLSLSYGTTEVLKDITLSVAPGEFFALLGPSGSGKSTLLRLIAGFNPHQKGSLLIDGKDVSGTPPHMRNIGMVFQNYALWPHMTVWDNVAFGLVERKVDKQTLTAKVEAALDLVGLKQYAKRRPSMLSGGQQQRVALARTIVIEPQVLLLDEPLSNLDKNLRVQMREELKNLQRTLGLTTIFVTHDQEEAMTTADRMAVLDKGILQQVGSATNLFDYPDNKFVAGFVGTANLIDGNITAVNGESVRFVGNGLAPLTFPKPYESSPKAGHAAMSVRPHQVAIQVRGELIDNSRVWLDGQVESSEFLGEFARYRVRVGEAEIVADQPHYSGLQMFKAGEQVRLGIEPSQVRFLSS
ncbi:ABC transporter ATP-binding protein [Acidovorax sp. JMULE5]|uniref:ABC transporter ATP-binding protein n=1 Tax=Acidovorax sp. JMULE5 TaxID=2518343 RepID=UPI0015A47970|nr:ABC transporter ATP-binding protein [Acidovorax sp. JMULE5]QLA82538.1 ABC transporter ATP-binding protein [Acidovorax sp. JMULE5]